MMNRWILQSERLGFRKICLGDFENLKYILQDLETMYAWGHAFTEEEVNIWIEKNLDRYEKEGFSYFAVVNKSTGDFLGVIGPLLEEIAGVSYVGIAYILHKKYWGQGYGVEGATACLAYAFDIIKADKVIAEIRPENGPSRRVAEKLGMKIEGEFMKHYKGKDLSHLIYSIMKNTWDDGKK